MNTTTKAELSKLDQSKITITKFDTKPDTQNEPPNKFVIVKPKDDAPKIMKVNHNKLVVINTGDKTINVKAFAHMNPILLVKPASTQGKENDPLSNETDSPKQFLFERKVVILNERHKALMEKQGETAQGSDTQQTANNKKTKKHKCQKCGEVFATTKELFNHKKGHVIEKYPCCFCGKLFKTLANVQKHENAHRGIRFPCPQCKKELATKHQLRIHMRRHSGEFTFKCDECGKGYYNIKAYRYHVESEHKGIRYKCEYCPSVLKSKRYWKDHLAKHISKNLKPHKCKICHKLYSSHGALNGHMKIHTGERLECPICGKKSTQRAAHIVHMRLHTGDKKFVCDFCGKAFIRKDMMLIHIRRHHESSQFPCTICSEVYGTKYKLLIHLHSHDEVDKPFQCQHCKEQFINNNFLRIHVNKIHIENRDDPFSASSQKPKVRRVKITRPSKIFVEKYVCSVCNESFLQNDDLQMHRREHLGEGAEEYDEEKYGDKKVYAEEVNCVIEGSYSEEGNCGNEESCIKRETEIYVQEEQINNAYEETEGTNRMYQLKQDDVIAFEEHYISSDGLIEISNDIQ